MSWVGLRVKPDSIQFTTFRVFANIKDFRESGQSVLAVPLVLVLVLVLLVFLVLVVGFVGRVTERSHDKTLYTNVLPGRGAEGMPLVAVWRPSLLM